MDPGEDHLPHPRGGQQPRDTPAVKCNSYCRRKKRVGSTFITRCRFGFPRQTRETTNLLSVEECMKLFHRKFTILHGHLRRYGSTTTTLLLMLWKANMDFQYIGESSLAIAQYVTGYVTKAEKSNMQDPLTPPSTASCGPLASAACPPGSVVSTRLVTFSLETTCVKSPRPSSGSMCPRLRDG